MARLFVHNLTVLDFAFLHPTRGIVGESLRVHIELGGKLDAQGMVLDFGDVKREVKRTLDEHFDHCFVVPRDLPGLRLDSSGANLHLELELANGSRIEHDSPSAAVAIIAAEEVTADTLTTAAQELLRPLLPGNVEDLRLELEPESIDGAYFHYAHGLKRHGGNCQRIAHGHRSRIEISRDGQRDPVLETQWAKRWQDIYIGSREDLLREDTQHYAFAYLSQQGSFELTLPREHCYLIDSDSTIELLAQHVADRTASEQASGSGAIEARVFEGVDKGAFGRAR